MNQLVEFKANINSTKKYPIKGDMWVDCLDDSEIKTTIARKIAIREKCKDEEVEDITFKKIEEVQN